MTEKLLSDRNYIYCEVRENIKEIKENINNAAVKAGRDPGDITLLAATKTVPVDVINYAISQGIKDIGENRVQELVSKYDDLNLDNCNLHMIGKLQTNKVKKIIDKVKLIQSVDSLKLANEISIESSKRNVVSNVLIEVNVGREKNKSGVFPENLEELIVRVGKLENLKVKGLMAIPPICDKKSEIRRYFADLNKIFVDIKSKKLDNVTMGTLSMGMSSDYIEAIMEGSTMIRVGSSIFGKRNY